MGLGDTQGVRIQRTDTGLELCPGNRLGCQSPCCWHARNALWKSCFWNKTRRFSGLTHLPLLSKGRSAPAPPLQKEISLWRKFIPHFIEIFFWNQGAFRQTAGPCQTPALSWEAAEALKYQHKRASVCLGVDSPSGERTKPCLLCSVPGDKGTAQWSTLA